MCLDGHIIWVPTDIQPMCEQWIGKSVLEVNLTSRLVGDFVNALVLVDIKALKSRQMVLVAQHFGYYPWKQLLVEARVRSYIMKHKGPLMYHYRQGLKHHFTFTIEIPELVGYTQADLKLPHLEIGTYQNCLALLFFQKVKLCKGQLRFDCTLADWVL